MDSFAVKLDRELPVGTPVVLLGHGVLAEAHARIAGTINYELLCRIESGPLRARRTIIDA
jgi:alanine racemase